MIRDITIGQYYPANSVIHRLDPRVKIVATLLFLISLFPSHLSDRGIVDHDIYNHSECTDRWDREAAPTAEQSESSGT